MARCLLATEDAGARGQGRPRRGAPIADRCCACSRRIGSIGIDRFIGVDLFEAGAAGAIGESYILDYAPDFIEGIGERLTVTTANHREVEQLLEVAMTELGLAEVEHSVGDVLASLTVVSDVSPCGC